MKREDLKLGKDPGYSLQCTATAKTSGNRCKNKIARFARFVDVCGTHLTPAMLKRAEIMQEIWDAGHQHGRKQGEQWGRQSVLWEQERERSEVERERVRAENTRYYTLSGSQIVECGGRYAYVWDGEEPLKVGDVVVTPTNWASGFMAQAREMPVTRLGSDYQGAMSGIVRKVVEVPAEVEA